MIKPKEGLDTSFYHENGYGKKDPKVLKIHQRESGAICIWK